MESVGDEGTIVMAAYTKSFLKFKKNNNIVFDTRTKTISGARAQAFLNDDRAVRSTHPTNSYVGLGKHATEILNAHTPHSESYSVMGEINKRDGKYLMIGTLDSENCPITMHYAQELLGHTLQHPQKNLFQSYYKSTEGSVKFFTRRDYGGCAKGGYKLYDDLKKQNAVTFGNIGCAESALMLGTTSTEIIKAALKKNRKIILCANKNCVSCYGNFANNGLGIIPFYMRYVLKLKK